MKYKLKALIVGMGYKHCEFAEKVGISREYLRQLENGKAKNPSITIMKKISELLGVSAEELFF
ncbi:helix-turn-helix transcriptional regulator [Clostridium sp. 19966]|uniref:helix-turn-helix transcriptional regulator n=1 Tax=Clostridium sp. 19966 TaxID=2768166 RepID=UPI0028EBDC5A|nr:helix-turn-helix transcriptional regulator [Clostridium sp. 19966]